MWSKCVDIWWMEMYNKQWEKGKGLKGTKLTCLSDGSHSSWELLKWLAHRELLINKGHIMQMRRRQTDRQRRRRQWQGAPEYEIGNKIKISCQSFIILFQMLILLSQWKVMLWERQIYDACYRLTHCHCSEVNCSSILWILLSSKTLDKYRDAEKL